MSHPLPNLTVPLNVPIGPLQSGSKILIGGVPNGKERFTVNLVCGPGPNDDIALHFDVRFDVGKCHNRVVLNYKIGGKWGGEDLAHTGPFPFKFNEAFELTIKVKDEAFKLTVNDEKFDYFPFRIPIAKVTHLNIAGQIKLNFVKV